MEESGRAEGGPETMGRLGRRMDLGAVTGCFCLLWALLVLALWMPGEAGALELGGELEIVTSFSYRDGELSTVLSGRGELELYIPPSGAVEPRLVVTGDMAGGQTGLGIRYMYLRCRLNGGHLTLGRQPVSWSYGALLNLLDYRLGIEGLAGETITPGIDGLRYHHRLGEGRSLQLVASYPEDVAVGSGGRGWNLDDLGYGSRLRLPGRGHDLSLNLSCHPVTVFPGGEGATGEGRFPPTAGLDDHLLRVGPTYSGDIGDVGVYGALGYFALLEDGRWDLLTQMGVDYSWRVGEFGSQQVFLQAEYSRFLREELDVLALSGLMPSPAPGADTYAEGGGAPGELLGGRDLWIANLSLRPDLFSTLGVAVMTEGENWTAALAPYYTTDLGGGLELRIDGSLLRDGEGVLQSGLSTGLSYVF